MRPARSAGRAAGEPGAERGIPVHTDAVQAVGRIPVNFHALGVTTLAASATSFTARWGWASCWSAGGEARSRLLAAVNSKGRRPGTVAVPLAVGLATALERWQAEAEARIDRWARLRDRLEAGLIAALGADRVIRNGPTDPDSTAASDPQPRIRRASTATPS